MADPIIVTERLEMSQPTAADMRPMHEIVSDPGTGRHLGAIATITDHYMRFARNAGSWLLYGYGGFMLRKRGDPQLIGNCGIFHSWRDLGDDFDDSPEAGWIVTADEVGKGYASEAMTAALKWFEREHGKRRIVCMISPDNEPSIALAKKLGFSAMREAVLPDGDTVVLFERLP